MQKYLFLFVFLLGAQLMIAQNDDAQDMPQSVDPFDELLQQFDLNDLGNGIFMDTMIIRQFGDLGLSNSDLEESMQEMMKMFEKQFQDLNFGDMQDLNKLFEGFDIEGFPPIQDLDAPSDSDNGDENKRKSTKKKRKVYKL